jgi:hypothetical protein
MKENIFSKREEDPDFEADVKKYGKDRANHRAALRKELARMTIGKHDYPFEGCTEPELSDWWEEYNAEFG